MPIGAVSGAFTNASSERRTASHLSISAWPATGGSRSSIDSELSSIT
jgi:hypothetical protein